jgi:hypothetical protein
MKLTPGQRQKLRWAISEALAFRTWVAIVRKSTNKRPTMADCEARIAEIKHMSQDLLTNDATHAAICDRCVDAIEEGLI